jgi:hypothetical protein
MEDRNVIYNELCIHTSFKKSMCSYECHDVDAHWVAVL